MKRMMFSNRIIGGWPTKPTRHRGRCLLPMLTGLLIAIGSSQAQAQSVTSSASDGTRQLTDAETSDRASDQPNETQSGDEGAEYRNEVVRGRFVYLAEALSRHWGISTVPEAAERVIAIETRDGQVLPILEDLRGRSFRRDERLRQMDLELLVRRHRQHPMLRVIRVYEWRDGKKYEVDYWCDICSIPMYEAGPCACCQMDNRLRKRLIDSSDPSSP